MGLMNIGSRTSSQGKISPLEAMGTRFSCGLSTAFSVRLVRIHSRTGRVSNCLFTEMYGDVSLTIPRSCECNSKRGEEDGGEDEHCDAGGLQRDNIRSWQAS